MKDRKLTTFLGLTFLLLFAFAMPAYGGDDAPRISTEELQAMLGSSNLVLLDVRTAKDWKKSDKKIVGAVRVDPDDVSSWAGDYGKDQKIILYCA
jgi:rhodanese-related sulfurtransferase